MYNSREAVIDAISSQFHSNHNFSLNTFKEKLSKIWDYFPPDLPEPSYFNTNIVQDPWLTYPYDKELIFKVIETFVEAGWKYKWLMRESEVAENSYPKIRFDTEGLSTICEFQDNLSGSTCQRKIIGKKSIEVDIVEFICGDAG